jgi:integrase/recombinase XerC
MDLIDAHVAHLRAGGYAARTIRDRGELLARMDDQLPEGLYQATTDELEQWLADPTWSQWTRVTYHSHVRGFFRWACAGDDPHLDWDPSAALARPRNPARVPHPITEEELNAALSRSDRRWRLVITLAGFAGLRAGEISRLRREDVTAEAIRVVKGKGGRDAVLPTHPAIWALVARLPAGLLVRTRTGKEFTDDQLSVMARHHFDSIDMPEVHLHRLRHRFATQLIRSGADIRTVQELMRHSSLATTAGYIAVTDEQRVRAVAGLATDHDRVADIYPVVAA